VIAVYSGSCLCESVRYEIDSDLQAVVNCHCRYCSRAHGAPFTTLLFAPFSSLRILAGAEHIARYPIERLGADRCFCRKCGTRLYNHARSAGRISLIAATLEAGVVLRPRAHINTESKCSWFQIGDALPQFASVPALEEFRQLLSS
jgi:hypothetical protein